MRAETSRLTSPPEAHILPPSDQNWSAEAFAWAYWPGNRPRPGLAISRATTRGMMSAASAPQAAASRPQLSGESIPPAARNIPQFRPKIQPRIEAADLGETANGQDLQGSRV